MTLIVNSALFGILVFFSAIISPTIFRVLDQTHSALIIRAIFPKVFLVGMVLSALSGISSFFYQILMGVSLSCLALILFALNFWYFMPAINETRDNLALDPARKNKRFRLLHAGSILNYCICILISLSLIFLR